MMEPILFAGYVVAAVVAAFMLGRFQGFAKGSTWADDREAILDAMEAEDEAMRVAGLAKKIAGLETLPRNQDFEKVAGAIDVPPAPDPIEPAAISVLKPPFLPGRRVACLMASIDAAIENRFGDPLAARYIVNGVRLSAWTRADLVLFRRFMIENTLGFTGDREPETKGPLWTVQGQATWDSDRRGWFITKDHTMHVAIRAVELPRAPDVPIGEFPGTIYGTSEHGAEDLHEIGEAIDDLLGDL